MAGYSKAKILEISNQLANAYKEGEREILELIQKADLTDWQRARANRQLNLIRDTLDELGEVTSEWGQTHLPGMYKAGVNRVDSVTGKELETFTKIHTESIEMLSENIVNRFDGALDVVGRQVDDVFRQAGLTALQAAQVRGETLNKTIKRMVSDLTEQGITAFKDKAGREWTLGNYSEMVARTTSREVQNTGMQNRMLEIGEDLVRVSTHGGACELCTPWEGDILSISGESGDYPSVADAEAEGLFHPNCVHVLNPYIPRYT